MKVSVIGSGISGMVSACYLAQKGYDVSIYEKNSTPGGRARQFTADGFTFDMGPSWYWMPDVFENFFNDFGKSASDYYDLTRLSPSYTVYFENTKIDVPSTLPELEALFESLEPGSAKQLQAYLADAEKKYELGMGIYAQKPSLNLTEFMNTDILLTAGRLDMFSNMEKHIAHYFKHPAIQKIMQFPVIFLGAMPKHIPAMYSLMNYADSALGTWYPQGGMFKIVEAIYSLATSLGVKFYFDHEVREIKTSGNRVSQLIFKDSAVATDMVIGSGDYKHIEYLLPDSFRNYDDAYWQTRKMAPSCLIFYIGLSKKLPLQHHNLFFDADFDLHSKQLYEAPQWPSDPLFYVCAPSVTDALVAPAGHENLFILIPIAAGLEDNAGLHDSYFKKVMARLEQKLGTTVKDHVCYRRTYSVSDFEIDYNAFKGNAYGLANTLGQTAFLKPKLINKKIKNLIYCGQLTVPGPGLPPAFLSGKMAAAQAVKQFKKINQTKTPIYEQL